MCSRDRTSIQSHSYSAVFWRLEAKRHHYIPYLANVSFIHWQQHRICLNRCIFGGSFIPCWLFFPVQSTRSSAVASASSPFSHDFALFAVLSAIMLPSAGARTLHFLSSKMVRMKSISFRSLDGLLLTKCAPEPARRLDGFGYHLSRETARIQAFRLSSLTGKTQKRIPDSILKRLVLFTAQQRTGIVH